MYLWRHTYVDAERFQNMRKLVWEFNRMHRRFNQVEELSKSINSANVSAPIPAEEDSWTIRTFSKRDLTFWAHFQKRPSILIPPENSSVSVQFHMSLHTDCVCAYVYMYMSVYICIDNVYTCTREVPYYQEESRCLFYLLIHQCCDMRHVTDFVCEFLLFIHVITFRMRSRQCTRMHFVI